MVVWRRAKSKEGSAGEVRGRPTDSRRSSTERLPLVLPMRPPARSPCPHALTQCASSMTSRASRPRLCRLLRTCDKASRQREAFSERREHLRLPRVLSAAPCNSPLSAPEHVLQAGPLDQLLGRHIQQLGGGPRLGELQEDRLQRRRLGLGLRCVDGRLLRPEFNCRAFQEHNARQPAPELQRTRASAAVCWLDR